jgi:hypothetical protein
MVEHRHASKTALVGIHPQARSAAKKHNHGIVFSQPNPMAIDA